MEQVQPKVEVDLKADAEKSQSYWVNEVHREHIKNEVSIFCSSLRKGFYIFAVSLMPRYNGIYHLNPARAELMYFPTFFGREGMKEVSVN